jgi:hypothetical protein
VCPNCFPETNFVASLARLLIKNFVAQMLAQERQNNKEQSFDDEDDQKVLTEPIFRFWSI